jgi:hypothetical protein
MIESYLQQHGLRTNFDLMEVHQSCNEPEVTDLLYRPGLDPQRPPSIEWAISMTGQSRWPLLTNLVPLLPVDDESFACVLLSPASRSEPILGEGTVVRWHIGVAGAEHQATIIDTSARDYVESVAAELRARPEGLRRMYEEIGPAYEVSYLNDARRPRDYVVRPVRLACQNVIVGLAAFAHDSAIDGMSVVAWQTCEAPHVGIHEGNRALAALMLCDAFQSGGTMEIRFDRPARVEADGTTKSGRHVSVRVRYQGHPEFAVPASLRRYGRAVGVELGKTDSACISPSEARELFLAVTPMPPDLKARVRDATERGVATPERICFTLLSQIWREIEVDYLLAVSDRAESILQGGAHWERRAQRQAEAQLTRASLMIGMLYRRLDTLDLAAAEGEVRVIEDNRVGVSWKVLATEGAVVFSDLRAERVPWQDTVYQTGAGEQLVVLPRSTPTVQDVTLAQHLQQFGRPVLVVPADADLDDVTADGIPILRCPLRLAELDQAVEMRLLRSQVARA